jgi:peptidase E
MRLLLSSWFLTPGSRPPVLPAALRTGRAGIVLNALDGYRPEFAYGGYSAGSCVAGPDLQGIDLMDDPAVLPEGYPPAAEPECLRLVPYRIVPHWRSDHPETEAAERAAAYLAGKGLPHRCLRDGEAVSVRPGDDEFSAR